MSPAGGHGARQAGGVSCPLPTSCCGVLAMGVSGSGRESQVSDVWTCLVGPEAPAHTAGGSLPEGPCGLTPALTMGPSPRPPGREVWLPGWGGRGVSGAQVRRALPSPPVCQPPSPRPAEEPPPVRLPHPCMCQEVPRIPQL